MASTKWPEMPWHQVVERVQKCVYRVYAGPYAGSSFVLSLGTTKEGEAFALHVTAWHVLEDIVGTGEDIRLVSADRKVSFDNKSTSIEFMSLGDTVFDTALVMVKTGKPLFAETDLLPILPYDAMLARGAEIGWLGFPGLVEPELCFFHGFVSGYLNDPPTYLVDGVAINGVSGGPAFDNRAHLIGLVSAYIPNQVDDETTLPGLMTLVPINAIRYAMEHLFGARVL